MNDPVVSRVTYAFLAILNIIIGQTLIEIGKGTVPFPDSMAWSIPIIVAGLNAITWFLPRIGSERIAQRVNALKAMGVPRSRMRVVDVDNPHLAA